MSRKETPHTPSTPSANAHAHGAPGSWSFGLFECFSPKDTCCLACFCPCIMNGKIYDHIRNDNAESNGINLQCFLYALLLPSGFNTLLSCVNRGSVREKYGIEGNEARDCAIAWCCSCNAMVQEYNELILRETGVNPQNNLPYTSPAPMSHP